MGNSSELHRLVITYIEEQSRILKEKTGITYITNEDIKDISTWEIQFIESFLSYLYDTEKHNDSNICPWCYRYLPSCSSCSYGSRHGSCDGDSQVNTYGMIINTLHENEEIDDDCGIYSLKEIVDATAYVKECYENFLYVKKLKEMLK